METSTNEESEIDKKKLKKKTAGSDTKQKIKNQKTKKKNL